MEKKLNWEIEKIKAALNLNNLKLNKDQNIISNISHSSTSNKSHSLATDMLYGYIAHAYIEHCFKEKNTQKSSQSTSQLNIHPNRQANGQPSGQSRSRSRSCSRR